MDDRYCPMCGRKTLYHIEVCESDEDSIKTSWSCECTNMVVYICLFVEEQDGN